MLTRTAAAAALAASVLVAPLVAAQELVTQNVPARQVRLNVGGERIAYLPDGGCTCQPEAPVEAPPAPCNTVAVCRASRQRSAAAVVSAIDGGALEERGAR